MKKCAILAHSPSPIDDGSRRRWTLGVTALFLGIGMAGAIAVSRDELQSTTRARVVEQISFEATPLSESVGSVFVAEERIQRGDSVGGLFERLGVGDPEAMAFLRNDETARIFFRQLVPGRTVVARINETGALLSLVFPLNGNETALQIDRTNQGFTARILPARFEPHVETKVAEIETSLFAASDAAGIPDAVAIQLAEVFSAEIDFHRDLRRGDRFSVVYEMNYLDGQPARSGRILAAEFVNNGRTHTAIWFEHQGRGAYYGEDGSPMRRTFLRSPLEFSRITSGFAMRLHPILQEWRAHRGIDYGAPTGTRVRATADGVVEFAATQGGYGRLLVLRHSSAYSTAYGHLSGFAKGLKKGTRVSQGETIGYVGQSGWATGPHLHYEFRVNNQQVDPLAFISPPALPLESSQLKLFRERTREWGHTLTLLRDASAASAN